MGWTHCAYATNYKIVGSGWRRYRVVDRRKECDKVCTWERQRTVGEDGTVYPAMKDTVLKSAMVGTTYYAAIRREVEGKQPYVWAAIFLTCGRTKWDNTEWGYKDMDETMQPYYYDCPKGILDLLTPTDNEGANKWREECRRQRAEANEIRRKGPQPKFLPNGIGLEERRASWILTSPNFRCKTGYRGTRYTKRYWHEFDRALLAFLTKYGTAEERAEYAAAGKECPAEWMGKVA